jgi:hypothetical protein
MAIAQGKLAGTAFLTIDGVNYLLQGEPKWRCADITRETLAGSDGIHGFKEKPIAGYISGRLRDADNITVADFNAMTNSTVVLELANGKVIIGRNMWTVEAQEVDSEDAVFDVRFESPFVEEA